MDSPVALNYYGDTALCIYQPTIPSPAGEIRDKLKVVSVHPAPNTPFNPITSSDNYIYIQNLKAGTRYTVSVVSTLGGHGSDATSCKTALSDPLESQVVQAVACTGEYVIHAHIY